MPEYLETDFLIIGSGVAGLYTAIRVAKYGSVTLVTKGRVLDSNTWYAQGGIAAAMSKEDSPQEHLQDTLIAGAGLCVEDAVAVLVEDGPQRVLDLISLGVSFDRSPTGELLLGREAAHSHRRIVHARGDATGAELAELLANHAKHTRDLRIIEHSLALDLLMHQGRCVGAVLLTETGKPLWCLARGTVLATGGCGQIYKHTTNPAVATGDGLAMAARAGAVLLDMEFVQFHPTALAFEENPMPLVSEAVRGEGAVLLTDKGKRFMPDLHPWAELAPRNVVARAIFDQMQQGHLVFLDATGIGESFSSHFPTIFRFCRERGVDPRYEPIPVAPAAHFIMGGVETSTEGATTIPGLFACGEVACTGVHGANRLASNSLLEGLVFAERVAHSLRLTPVLVPTARCGARPASPSWQPTPAHLVSQVAELTERIQRVMWNMVGIVRTEAGLVQAERELSELAQPAMARTYPVSNMLQVANYVVRAAARRTESRGGHYRRDFPQEDQWWGKRRIAVTPSGLDIVALEKQLPSRQPVTPHAESGQLT